MTFACRALSSSQEERRHKNCQYLNQGIDLQVICKGMCFGQGKTFSLCSILRSVLYLCDIFSTQELNKGAIRILSLSFKADVSPSATNCTRSQQVTGWRRKMNHLDSAAMDWLISDLSVKQLMCPPRDIAGSPRSRVLPHMRPLPPPPPVSISFVREQSSTPPAA